MHLATRRGVLGLLTVTAIALAACGSDEDAGGDAVPATSGDSVPATSGDSVSATSVDSVPAESEPSQPLRISAIPDQDPEVLARTYETVTAYLSDALGVDVEYVPVTDYAASVTLSGPATSTSCGSAG